MKRLLYFTITVALLGAGLVSPANAIDPTDKCVANKLTTAGKYMLCQLKTEAKAVKTGTMADLTKCNDKLTAKWEKIEIKGGDACPTGDDLAAVQALLGDCALDVAGVPDETVVQALATECIGEAIGAVTAAAICFDTCGTFGVCDGVCPAGQVCTATELEPGCVCVPEDCSVNLDICDGDLGDCQSSEAQCQANLTNCQTSESQCLSDLGGCQSNGAQCQLDLTTCTDDLTTCNTDLGTAQGDLTTCTGDLSTCNTDLSTAQTDLSQCQTDLAECQAPPSSKLVFVSQSATTGNFGSINFGGAVVADGACQQEADALGFTGEFKAWVSDQVSSPSTRFTRHEVPYVLPSGTKVADGWTDLTDGSLDAAIYEYSSGSPAPGLAWTNTLSDGREACCTNNGSPGAHNCEYWVTDGECYDGAGDPITCSAVAGTTGFVDSRWSWNDYYPCFAGTPLHFYCFEQ